MMVMEVWNYLLRFWTFFRSSLVYKFDVAISAMMISPRRFQTRKRSNLDIVMRLYSLYLGCVQTLRLKMNSFMFSRIRSFCLKTEEEGRLVWDSDWSSCCGNIKVDDAGRTGLRENGGRGKMNLREVDGCWSSCSDDRKLKDCCSTGC